MMAAAMSTMGFRQPGRAAAMAKAVVVLLPSFIPATFTVPCGGVKTSVRICGTLLCL
jgi:hypothetical protein